MLFEEEYVTYLRRYESRLRGCKNEKTISFCSTRIDCMDIQD